jgi:hypothetical protein
MTRFTEDLAIKPVLTIDGQSYSIPPGNVKTLALSLNACGFSGKISFVIPVEGSTDKLLSPLTKNDLIELALEVGIHVKPSNAKFLPLKLNGLVSTKGFFEQTLTNVMATQKLMLYRHYHLEFADPAQVLWKQHYPCDLLTDSTLETLITAHTSDKIKLNCNWEVLKTQYSVLSLSLGIEDNQASFYDYLMWLVDSNNGVFSYDYGKNQYSLTATKNASGTVNSLNALEIDRYGMDFPETRRYQANVLNAFSDAPKTTSIANDQYLKPMRHDYVARYPITADMDARVALEKARFKQRQHEVWVDFKNVQMLITPPGDLVNFAGALWSTSLFVHGNSYRVREWHLQAQAVDEQLAADLNMPFGHYDMEHRQRYENKDELWVDLPSFVNPVYPFYVEGKILSEQGGDDDNTYQFYQDKKTSVQYYQVVIPLWENKKIRAAYQPNMDTGHFYFPPYKNARVLVGLGFDSAIICEFLDWSKGAALTLESQGNQLVMGKSTTSQNIIKHTYVDSKPQLQIQRTQDKDTELLQFSDGYIILQTLQQEGDSK